MKHRKIIEFGKSSYVVSLPKEWMKSMELGKGDILYVATEQDKLVLHPTPKTDVEHTRSISIDITEKTLREVKFRLVSAYIRNFNEIIIIDRDLRSRSKDICAIIQDLMSLEVIEENSDRIVTKIFLGTTGLDPLDLIHKMDSITRDMIIDSKKSIDEDNMDNIMSRDSNVNRLSYLVFRILKCYSRNPMKAMQSSITHELLLPVWVAAENIEKIADRSKWISKLLRRANIEGKDREEFIRLYSDIESFYIDSMDIFYKRDRERAFAMGDRYKMLIKKCRDYHRHSNGMEWVPIILEKMKDIISDSKELLTYICNVEDDDREN